VSAPGTAVAPATPAAGEPGRTHVTSGTRRRWPRLVVPVAVVALFWALALAAHSHQQPDLRDPGTLSPTGTGPHGSSQLADRLRQQGVTVIPVTSTDAALATASRLDATIFVPTPELAGWWLLDGLRQAQGRDHRVVLVRPGARARDVADIVLTRSRWATRTVAPRCDLPEAVAAGAAAVYRDVYAGGECYGGSLIEHHLHGVDIVAVGATDPFRNDRIDEAGNATLATGLLSRHGRVIWLDVHSRAEFRPPTSLPDINLPDYERPEQDRTNTGDPLLDSFPEQLWVGLVLLMGAGVLFAVARARRLGPPVPEPLPVLVPAAEAVLGRGRLYRRIRARGSSLAALRAAAIARLARALDPLTPSPERGLAAPGPARDAFVAGLADRAGVAQAVVTAVLFGPEPESDDELVQSAIDVDQLVTLVIPPPRPPGEPPP
jgi:hypothetical protein